MSQAIVSTSASSAVPVAAGESSQKRAWIGSCGTSSRLIGALFLLGFLSYGVGFGLVTSVVSAPDLLTTVSTHQTILVLGAFLMLLNSVVDVGKGVLFFPILERHSKRTALAYLAAMIVEVVLLDVGVLALLMLVPIAHQGIDAGQAGVGWATALGALAVQSNTMSYQIAEMTLGFGAIVLCALLFRVRLIPRFLAMWGVLGYAVLATGAIAEVFGIHIGLVLSIPGGLFEVALGVWLLTKGFEPKAYGQES